MTFIIHSMIVQLVIWSNKDFRADKMGKSSDNWLEEILKRFFEWEKDFNRISSSIASYVAIPTLKISYFSGHLNDFIESIREGPPESYFSFWMNKWCSCYHYMLKIHVFKFFLGTLQSQQNHLFLFPGCQQLISCNKLEDANSWSKHRDSIALEYVIVQSILSQH